MVRRETHESRQLALKTPPTGPTMSDSDRVQFMRSGTLARARLSDPPSLQPALRSLVARLDLVDTLSNRFVSLPFLLYLF